MNLFWELIALKHKYQETGTCYCTIENQIAALSKNTPTPCIYCLSDFDDYDPDFAIKNIHEPDVP